MYPLVGEGSVCGLLALRQKQHGKGAWAEDSLLIT